MGPPVVTARPLLAALLVAAAAAQAAFAGDTTYSTTRAVPKTSSSTSSGTSYAGSDDSEGKLHFHGGCNELSFEAESVGALFTGLVLAPVIIVLCEAGRGFAASHVHLVDGEANLSRWSEGGWRHGIGLGFGATFIPGLAGGMPLNFQVEAVKNLSPDLHLRLRSGAFVAGLAPAMDFRRDVFVDGKRLGAQTDVMHGYTQAGIPLFVDFLHPMGGSGFYLGAGLGALHLYESVEFTRHTDWGASETSHEENRSRVLPAADLAIGRYGGGWRGRALWRFELRWQAAMHFPLHASSFPGDNGPVTHTLSWEWAVLW
jgi:hypothetical protein